MNGKVVICVCSMAVLTSCGGGDSDSRSPGSSTVTDVPKLSATPNGANGVGYNDPLPPDAVTFRIITPTATASPAPASNAPSFENCFKLTPGVRFAFGKTNFRVNVQEFFVVSDVFGEKLITPTYELTEYRLIKDGFINFLGKKYDALATGAASFREEFSNAARIPVTMTPGQTIELKYDSQIFTDSRPPFVVGVNQSFTFTGFENLTLDGKTFLNACKIVSTVAGSGRTKVFWLAEGFGTIRAGMETSPTRDSFPAVEMTNITAVP